MVANSSETRLAYVAESTWGTTPSSPSFTNMRWTSESLTPSLQTVTSSEIRADRNVTDLVETGFQAGGDVSFELSFDSFEDIFESLLYNTWSTNVLKNGKTEKSFTFEKKFDINTNQYHRFPGSIVDTMSLNVQAREIVTGTFGILSKEMTTAQSQISNATYSSANTNQVLNASSQFANLAMSGLNNTPTITGLTLDVANNLRQQAAVGQKANIGIGTGRFEVTGTLNAYFENKDLIDALLNNSSTPLTFRLGTGTDYYDITLPKIKFSSGQTVAGGNDEDVIAEMEFTALYDSAEDATMKIERSS
jgi:hypothetical protein